MNDLSTTLIAADRKAAYDTAVKEILADKQVLAWILRGTTTEFSDMDVENIIPYIENPSISSVAVNPGLTNSNQSAVTGLPQESCIIYENVVYYDVRFFVRNPFTTSKKSIHIIVDLEAQKDSNPGYDLVTRGIFYCGRMLSEQAGRNFTKSNYDSLDKVYSIWICLNCPSDAANTISRYSISHEAIYGDYKDRSRHDMLQVVMVRLPSERGYGITPNSPSSLHEMLYDLIVRKIEPPKKVELLKDKYGMKMENHEGRISTMCNLSEGLIEQGIEQGKLNILNSLVQDGIIDASEAARRAGMTLQRYLDEVKKLEKTEIMQAVTETV